MIVATLKVPDEFSRLTPLDLTTKDSGINKTEHYQDLYSGSHITRFFFNTEGAKEKWLKLLPEDIVRYVYEEH